MKKAEKIRKIVTCISAGVIFACLLVMTLQIGFQGTGSHSPLRLSALTFGLFQPAMAMEAQGFQHCYENYYVHDPGTCGLFNHSCTLQNFPHYPCPGTATNGYAPYNRDSCDGGSTPASPIKY